MLHPAEDTSHFQTAARSAQAYTAGEPCSRWTRRASACASPGNWGPGQALEGTRALPGPRPAVLARRPPAGREAPATRRRRQCSAYWDGDDEPDPGTLVQPYPRGHPERSPTCTRRATRSTSPRKCASTAQVRAFQAVLDRLKSLILTAYIYEPTAIHVRCRKAQAVFARCWRDVR